MHLLVAEAANGAPDLPPLSMSLPMVASIHLVVPSMVMLSVAVVLLKMLLAVVEAVLREAASTAARRGTFIF